MGNELKEGTIVAMFRAKAKAKSRDEWRKELDKFWDEDVSIIKTQKGFVGMRALWALDDSGEVVLMGIWDNLEDRLAYEQGVAKKVRSKMEATLEGGRPERPKYVVVKA